MKVACAIVVRDRQVLIQKRQRKQGRVWEFPTGKVEGSESFEEAAKRELQEETGLKGSVLGLPTLLLNGIDDAQVGFVFLEAHSQNPAICPERSQVFQWVKPTEIPLRDFHLADQKFIEKYLAGFLELCA